MKKNILKITFAAALVVVAGVTAYHAQDKEILSDLALANVEALADDEYVIGPPMTNWKQYRIQCTRVVGFDYILKIEKTTTYWTDGCGSGSGNCLKPAGC